MLKRRAVTATEWRIIGRLLLFPITVIVIYLFGVINFVHELVDDRNTTTYLEVLLISAKNILAGTIDVTKDFKEPSTASCTGTPNRA